MRGLAYLQWRCLVNEARGIRHSPIRLTLWITYILFNGAFIYARALRPAGTNPFAFVLPFGETIAGGFAGYFGLQIAIAATGRGYGFRNAAEPVLFVNAGIRPLEVGIWLQLRKIASGSARLFDKFAYLLIFFAPVNAGVFASARMVFAAVVAIALQQSIALPTFLVSRSRRRETFAFGCTLAAAGFGFGAITILAPQRVRPIVAFAHVDPGALLAALFAFDPRAILGAVAFLGVMVAIVALAGRDAMPEFYALAQLPARRSRRVRSAEHGKSVAARSAPSERIPAGALAVVWKEWTTFRRTRGKLPLFLAGCALCGVLGAALAVGSRIAGDPSFLLSFATMATLLIFLVTPHGAASGLANELGTPLFWLSKASLGSRIAAWTFARTWRAALAIGLAPLLLGIVSGNVALASAALPLTFATYWSLQSLGVGLFALTPNPLDLRGPMVFVRIVATFAYTLPAVAVAIVVTLAHGSPLLAALAAATAFVLEGYVVVEIAAVSFAERGASIATSARAG